MGGWKRQECIDGIISVIQEPEERNLLNTLRNNIEASYKQQEQQQQKILASTHTHTYTDTQRQRGLYLQSFHKTLIGHGIVLDVLQITLLFIMYLKSIIWHLERIKPNTTCQPTAASGISTSNNLPPPIPAHPQPITLSMLLILDFPFSQILTRNTVGIRGIVY